MGPDRKSSWEIIEEVSIKTVRVGGILALLTLTFDLLPIDNTPVIPNQRNLDPQRQPITFCTPPLLLDELKHLRPFYLCQRFSSIQGEWVRIAPSDPPR